MILRPYQQKAVNEIYNAWREGCESILYLSGTGTGKTVVFSHIMQHHDGVCIELAHRKELVDQASITLAKRGVYHSIIAPQKNIKLLCKEHLLETGKCYYSPHSKIYVASLKTLISKKENPTYRQILNNCTLYVVDEAHHAQKKNQYGKVVALMPNAKGLHVTATAQRTDGAGLGKHNDGLCDKLIEGPPVSWMIDQGYLTPYKIVAPLSMVEFDNDLQLKPQYKNKIIGDTVASYIKYTPGKIGATFCSSVGLSKMQALKYNQAGIPAAHLDGSTPTAKRNDVLRKLARGEILQLCNVDLVSEGFDLPALSVITVNRLTTSLIWHLQVSGRVLRPADGKTHGVIIDQVGNYLNPRLGLPDTPRIWTLDRRDKRAKNSKNTETPVKRCDNCLAVYSKLIRVCPYCGWVIPITRRTGPTEVHGDLEMLSPEMIKKISEASLKLQRSKEEVRDDFLKITGGNHLIANSNAKRHAENQKMQENLKAEILKWRYNSDNRKLSNSECDRLFHHIFNIDIISVQGLKTAEMKKIINKLKEM
jgi:superfamily II DNA or RNA helicase